MREALAALPHSARADGLARLATMSRPSGAPTPRGHA